MRKPGSTFTRWGETWNPQTTRAKGQTSYYIEKYNFEGEQEVYTRAQKNGTRPETCTESIQNLHTRNVCKVKCHCVQQGNKEINKNNNNVCFVCTNSH